MNTIKNIRSKINNAQNLFEDEIGDVLRTLSKDFTATPVKKHIDRNGNTYCEAMIMAPNPLFSGLACVVGLEGARGRFRSAKRFNAFGYSPKAFGGVHDEYDATEVSLNNIWGRLYKVGKLVDQGLADSMFYEWHAAKNQTDKRETVKSQAAKLLQAIEAA